MLAGWLRAQVRENCSRCLAPTRRSVDCDFSLRLEPETEAPAEPETELDEVDLDVEYYAGESLDLRAILAEQVVLESPLKVLCHEDCKGLCSLCGADQNVQPCDCEPPTDPRLSKLIDLRDRL